jgi:hypothetical protein
MTPMSARAGVVLRVFDLGIWWAPPNIVAAV